MLVNSEDYLIAGVDEAGRGPLAGPVVAAAVILRGNLPLDGVMDSKKITEKKREQLYSQIIEQSLSYGISIVSHQDIDQINILQATMLAMTEAVAKLDIRPNQVLVDGNQVPPIKNIDTQAIVKGDQKIPAISAASILAKVTRDRLMRSYCEQYPGYGFSKHKGYGTKMHMDMIKQLGPCAIHRLTFAPICHMVDLEL